MKALGLIETQGLTAAIEAADAAVKSAYVVVTDIEITEPGLVTVKLRGGVADIQAAVEAGAAAARRVGEVVSAHVIANLHEDVEKILPSAPEDTLNPPKTPAKNSPKKNAAKKSTTRKRK
jgi:microcompartment protein CcmL/EutN